MRARWSRLVLAVLVPLVAATLVRGVVTRITDVATGADVVDAALEPEPLAGLYDRVWEERRVLPLDQIPRPVVHAVLAAEDHRFYEHGAIDFRGILRALVRNL